MNLFENLKPIHLFLGTLVTFSLAACSAESTNSIPYQAPSTQPLTIVQIVDSPSISITGVTCVNTPPDVLGTIQTGEKSATCSSGLIEVTVTDGSSGQTVTCPPGNNNVKWRNAKVFSDTCN